MILNRKWFVWRSQIANDIISSYTQIVAKQYYPMRGKAKNHNGIFRRNENNMI